MALRINELMRKFFLERGLILVDYKLEFGLFDGRIVLADEISPDTCRLWDVNTREKLDKDRFPAAAWAASRTLTAKYTIAWAWTSKARMAMPRIGRMTNPMCGLERLHGLSILHRLRYCGGLAAVMQNSHGTRWSVTAAGP